MVFHITMMKRFPNIRWFLHLEISPSHASYIILFHILLGFICSSLIWNFCISLSNRFVFSFLAWASLSGFGGGLGPFCMLQCRLLYLKPQGVLWTLWGWPWRALGIRAPSTLPLHSNPAVPRRGLALQPRHLEDKRNGT